jgi:hypothetical protein
LSAPGDAVTDLGRDRREEESLSRADCLADRIGDGQRPPEVPFHEPRGDVARAPATAARVTVPSAACSTIGLKRRDDVHPDLGVLAEELDREHPCR